MPPSPLLASSLVAHLDIAGVNQADKATSLVPKGMTGFGVRLLDQLARSGE